ncbi:superoxide dismutase [bacterium]|nr:superoxide dismutase [bacterium]
MDRHHLPSLRYAYDALEPVMDEKTLFIHHQGHHRGYVDKLNEALQEYPDIDWPVDELLIRVNELPPKLGKAVRTQGGGHANHSLFWTVLSPVQQDPPETLLKVFSPHFGSYEQFRKRFTEVASSHFGSGWAWLCADKRGQLSVFSTKDHESPLSHGLTPLLVLDLWEHAYYLKHQNRRPEFIESFWKIVNWEEVASRWEEHRALGVSRREWLVAS